MTQIFEQIERRHKKSLLSKKETAEELNISQATLDRLRKDGKIKSKKIGGGVYFTLQEIVTFINS